MTNEEKVIKAVEEQEAKGTAKDAVFAAHPHLDVYYKTSDGVAFFTKNAADQHVAELKDKTVKKVTR